MVSVPIVYYDNTTKLDQMRTVFEIISGAGEPFIISKMD